MLRGIYHSHSNFSYDGVMSLGEIAGWCRQKGFDFIMLTEHNDDFSLEKFRDHHKQCQDHSEGVLLIPGLEYEFIINKKVVHVGAVGLEKYFDINVNPMSLENFLDAVRKNGGVSVLHHPHRIMDVLSDGVICKFDFIETWNVVHDIRYSPNKKVFLKTRQAGFKGQYLASRDIHYFRDKDKSPYVILENSGSTRDAKSIIQAFNAGNYYVHSKFCKIHPDGTFEPSKAIFTYLPAISFWHQRAYETLRRLYKKMIKVTPPKCLVKALK